MEKRGLSIRTPDGAARPLAVAISRTIKHDDTVALCSERNQPTAIEILNHAAVAME